MSAAQTFDQWVHSGPFTARDVGIFRIIYSVCALLTVRDTFWLSEYPNSLFTPPPGPFTVLSGHPSASVLITLAVAQSVALVMLGLGMFTRLISIATFFLLLFNYGITYNLGKVDHTFLLVLAPLILAFANWGDRISIDSYRRPNRSRPQAQWPLRYLALATALAFFSAAFVKLRSGYLDLSTQSVRGIVLQRAITWGPAWLSDQVLQISAVPIWELIDWFVVFVEFAVVFSMPWWRSFRVALSIAAVFHFVVFLTLNIVHITEVVVYGAFVSWETVIARFSDRPPLNRLLASRRSAMVAIAGFVALGAGKTWAMLSGRDWIAHSAGVLILFIGAAVGLYHLGAVATCLRTSRSRSDADAV